MPESCQNLSEQAVSGDQSLSWRSWPLADEWPGSLVKAAVVVAMCAAVGVAFGGVGYALLATVFLVLSLARFFLPTRFVLDAAGVTRRSAAGRGQLAWTQIRRVVVGKAGVFLSPFERPSRLDSFRGVFLPFAGNAAEVTEFVRGKTNLVA